MILISINLSILASLLGSSILCFFSNSWLMLWILLEINTLSFCSITNNTLTSNINGENESLINYLIIQSVASIMLVSSSLITKSTPNNLNILSILIISSLILNSASAPLFQWFISVANNISWNNFVILLTWQKLVPTYLLVFQNNIAIFIPIVASMLTGTILIVNNTLVKEILAYSSLFNLSWIIISIIISINTFLLFTSIYWNILIISINPFISSNTSEINSTKTSSVPKKILFLTIIMLAGIPPLIGFSINWIIITNMINLTINSLITIMLIFSAVNLFVYLRIINSIIILYSNPHNNNLKNSLFFFNTILIFTNGTSFIIIIL